MDRKIINIKMESLRRCIERIESKLPISLSQLQQDYDLQDIVSLNLERAVQNAVDLATLLIAELKLPAPQTMAESFELLYQQKIIQDKTSLRMKKSVGFRNLLVHEYTQIDWKIVWTVIHHHLNDFRDFAQELETWLQSQNAP